MKELINIKIINNSNVHQKRIEFLRLKKYEKIKYNEHIEKSLKGKFSNPKIVLNIIIRYFNYYKKYFKYAFISLVFFLIYLLYFLSLEKCSEGGEKCPMKLGWIKKKVKEEICSSILLEIVIQLMIFKVISKKHLIHMLIIFILLFLYSHGLEFFDHGYFNFLYYFILLFILTFFFVPLDCILFYKKKKNIIKILFIYFLILIIMFVFVLLIINKIVTNCSDWPKGLNNTYIENNESLYGCQIQFPKLCMYKFFERFQDYSKLIGKNCVNNKDGKILRENILKKSNSPYINNKIKRIGYPLLNKDPKCFLDSPENNNTILEYFYENLVDMDNYEILNTFFKEKMPEEEIDFNKINDTKLIINLHYNKTLSKKRKVLEKNSDPYSNNILILYFDSLSRVNALRQLKKTTKFFENFMNYKGNFNYKYPSENFHSFQFFKYHSFNGYTLINFPFLFYGKNQTEINKSLVTKFFKENGFITSAAADWYFIDNIRTNHNFTQEDMYDHILLLCDPNNEHYNINTLRCLYGKHNTEYLLEYTNQFWEKYRNNRKYSIIIDNHGHEGTLTVIKYIDEIYENFLNNLFNNNLLKDTTIFLLSDHGVGMPSLYYPTDFYQREIDLPTLLLIINDRKNITYEEQYKYIYENQQIFITPFDIFNTLGNIIYGNNYNVIENNTLERITCKSPYGKSLFDKINPKQRYPMKYKYLGIYGISNNSCI